MKRLLTVALGGAFVAAVASTFALRGDPPAEAKSSGPTPPSMTRSASTCQDRDGDGYGLGCALGPDCNDRDATIHPGQKERCNFRDDDCNHLVDDLAGCRAPAIDRSTVTNPGGPFVMGSADGVGNADERPQHVVQVSTFRIDRTEVTNGRYEKCVAAGACKAPALASSRWRKEYYGNKAFADYPVIFVDHARATTFCKWAGGALPTEAQWEKAARGPSPAAKVYPWGDATPDCSRANMGGKGSCLGDTDRVGRRLAGRSAYGVLDMAGNVWEWTADVYAADTYKKRTHAKRAVRDPRGPARGNLRVMRGGCWHSGADSLRVSCRKPELPSAWAPNVGFRCVYAARSAGRR